MSKISKIKKGIKALIGLPFYVYKGYFQTKHSMNAILKELALSRALLENLYLKSAGKPYTLPKIFEPTHPIGLKRVGNNHGDGDYIVPESLLNATDVLVSYGIDCNYSFEECFHKGSGAKVFAYDESTKNFLDTDKKFRKKFESFFDGNKAQFIPMFIGKNSGQISITETLAAHRESNVCLKFDIEGAEYESWAELENLPQNVIGVICELHDALKHLAKITAWIKNSGFHLVHTHINNVSLLYREVLLIELTLVRPQFYSPSGMKPYYPIRDLDRSNVPSYPDYPRIEFSDTGEQ